MIVDSSNAAFVLSDSSVSLGEKFNYVLKQRWFWSLLIFLTLISMFASMLVYVIRIKMDLKLIVDRASWGASDPTSELKELILPVKRIIVTDTKDGDSCTTRVSIKY